MIESLRWPLTMATTSRSGTVRWRCWVLLTLLNLVICADGQGPCKSSHQYLCRASYLVRLRISRESDHVMFGCPSQRRHSKQPGGHFSALSSRPFSLGLKAMKNFALWPLERLHGLRVFIVVAPKLKQSDDANAVLQCQWDGWRAPHRSGWTRNVEDDFALCISKIDQSDATFPQPLMPQASVATVWAGRSSSMHWKM
jgi:hypothetical protein